MCIFAETVGGLASPERRAAFLGIAFLAGCGLWAFARSIFKAPRQPDPWDQQVATELDQDDCTPLCHHCLTPHDRMKDFCSNCGAAVGPYTNFLPFPYLFSIGHGLRIGTSERFRRSPLILAGFVLLSVAEYAVFAPVYWFKLAKNLNQISTEPQIIPPPAEAGETPV